MTKVLFSSKIFEKNIKRTKTQITADIYYTIGLILILSICASILIFVNKYLGIGLGVFSFLVFKNWHENNFGRFYYGNMDTQFELNSESIKIGSNTYLYEEITDLKFTNGYYIEQFRKKTRDYTPIDNTIEFNYQGNILNYKFLLNDFKVFINAYIFLLSEEKIPFKKENFYNVPVAYRNNEQFKNFIIKLIKEKRIEYSEGILIIGYKTYEEAKELKAKYCN